MTNEKLRSRHERPEMENHRLIRVVGKLDGQFPLPAYRIGKRGRRAGPKWFRNQRDLVLILFRFLRVETLDLGEIFRLGHLPHPGFQRLNIRVIGHFLNDLFDRDPKLPFRGAALFLARSDGLNLTGSSRVEQKLRKQGMECVTIYTDEFREK